MPTLKDSLRSLAAQRNKKEIEHPSLPGQTIWIQELTGAERDAWEQALAKKQGKDGKVVDLIGLRSKLIQMVLVDEVGCRVYSEAEVNDVDQLPSRFREDLFDAALEFNGLSKEAEQSQLKNSDSEAGTGSSAASQSSSENQTFGRYLNG